MTPLSGGEARTVFEGEVMRCCSATLSSLGLMLESSQPGLVRFTSRQVFAEVFYETRSLKVGIRMGLQPRREPVDAGFGVSIGQEPPPNTYSLEQIVTYTCSAAERATVTASFVGTSQAALRDGLTRLMDTAERHAAPFLRGDHVQFAILAERVSKAGELFTAKMQADDLRKAAGKAWLGHDYPAVVRILGLLGEPRTAVEEARLRYARKQPRTD